MKKTLDTYPVLRQLLSPALSARRWWLRRQRMQDDRLMQTLRRILVEDPVIEVEEFQGVFAVDVRSALFKRILFRRVYEPELVACCLEHLDPARDILDIGANIGFYSVLFAKQCSNGKVLAVEPTSNALKRLYKNIELNNVATRVQVYEGVVSNQIGRTEIKTIEGREEYSSLGVMDHPSIAETPFTTQEVQSTTLDHLVSTFELDPGFVKIDVEGVEHWVLEGGQTMLEKSRPVILSELSDSLLKKNGSSSQEVIQFIERFGYRVYDPINTHILPGSKSFSDILCIPK